MDRERIWEIAETVSNFSREECHEFRTALRTKMDSNRIVRVIESLSPEQIKDLRSAVRDLAKEE